VSGKQKVKEKKSEKKTSKFLHGKFFKNTKGGKRHSITLGNLFTINIDLQFQEILSQHIERVHGIQFYVEITGALLRVNSSIELFNLSLECQYSKRQVSHSLHAF